MGIYRNMNEYIEAYGSIWKQMAVGSDSVSIYTYIYVYIYILL